MKYRPEIDGLRAVAVLPVILFHAGFETFSGGYVGVDVFFVISGYLITGIIVEEIEKGTFSLGHFYERRARRILPALFLVMLCCIPFAWKWMLPDQFKDFGQSLVAVSIFASNVLFWHESGYFSHGAEEKPLLHTWSLAVEEQFYLIFPLLLLILWRLGRFRIVCAIGLVAALSLLFSEWASRAYPVANFYLAPSRVWELFAGSLCVFFHRQYGGYRNDFLALSGILLVAVSIFLFTESTRFPSFLAVVPVLGTMLIILFADAETRTAQLLSSRILVGIGLVSYSAYLWHQPLFAFARIRSIHSPDPVLFGILAIASFALAYLSWKYVERPFRAPKSDRQMKRTYLFGGIACIGAVFISIGSAIHFGNSAEIRANANGDTFKDLRVAEKLVINYGLNEICDGAAPGTPSCQTGPKPEIAILGDSYAMHLIDAFKAADQQRSLIQLTKSSCPPLSGRDEDMATIINKRLSGDCASFIQRSIKFIEESESIRTVVVSSQVAAIQAKLFGHGLDPLKSNERVQEIGDLILTTASRLMASGKSVVVVSPPPNDGELIGNCLAKAAWFAEPLTVCDFSPEEYSLATNTSAAILKHVEKQLPVVWLEKYICPTRECRASIDGIFIYRDGGHLTKEGSAHLGTGSDLVVDTLALN